MRNKKVLLIYESVHHGNTLQIAKAMSEVLQAQVIKSSDVSADSISDYDLIGFGSGIYNQRHHENLFALVDRLKAQNHKKAFIFSTNTFGTKRLHKPLNDKLVAKGFDVVAEFCCRGYFALFGFIKVNKERPNRQDLENAKAFAHSLIY